LTADIGTIDNMKGVASMKFSLTIAMFCALMMTARAADGAFWESGNDFVRYCSSIEKGDVAIDLTELTRGMHCMGYIQGLSAGVAETITFGTEKGYAVPVPFCIPEGVEVKQSVIIVLKYIRDHPEKAHIQASTLAMAALQKAFPCSLKK
jgi:hypothetical protein